MPDRFARIVSAAVPAPPAPFQRAGPAVVPVLVQAAAGRVRLRRRRRHGGGRAEPAVVVIALLIALAAHCPSPARAAEKLVRSRLCPEDAPEGVRLRPQPGCGLREVPAPKREAGTYDLGNGTGIRIGGRAGAVFDGRR